MMNLKWMTMLRSLLKHRSDIVVHQRATTAHRAGSSGASLRQGFCPTSSQDLEGPISKMR